MKNAYKDIVEDLCKKYPNLVHVVADSGTSELDIVRHKFPQRLVECGLAECNAIGVAAGIAGCGNIVVLYGMIPFLVYRGFEFIRNDICLQNMNVKIIGSGAGMIYNNLGPTHHATEDIAVMRALPNMVILSPSTEKEAKEAIKMAIRIDGPVYVRLGKGWETELYNGEYNYNIKKGIELKQGNHAAIIGTGSILADTYEAIAKLKKENINVRLINIVSIKPIDEEIIKKAALETKAILIVEEHNCFGGLTSAASEILSKNNISVKFDSINLNDHFCEDYGWYQDIKKLNGFTTEKIYQRIKKMIS